MINKDTLYAKLTALAGLGIRELHPLVNNYGLKYSIYRNGGAIFMRSILDNLISANKDKIANGVNILNEITTKDKYDNRYYQVFIALFRLGITSFEQLRKLGLRESATKAYIFKVSYARYYRNIPQNMLKNIIAEINSTLTANSPENKQNINNIINKYKNNL